jgi:hypothetical protein
MCWQAMGEAVEFSIRSITSRTSPWAFRNGIALSWNDWDLGTPGDTGNYSWDDSSTLAGMLDIPPTN